MKTNVGPAGEADPYMTRFAWRKDEFYTPFAVFVAGVIISSMLTFWSVQTVRQEGLLQFSRQADGLSTEIQRRLHLPGYGLKGARGMYLASEKITRAEFKAYVDSRDLQSEFPGSIGFGAIERVPVADLDAFVARERADGDPEFRVYPETTGRDKYIIKYIEPVKANRAAVGFDVGSESRRREAVERAILTGEPAMTARLDLVQDDKDLSGFLYLVPVYKQGMPQSTPAERAAALDVLVYAPIIIDYAFANLAEYTNDLLEFDVFDGADGSDAESLFDFQDHLSTLTGLNVHEAGQGGSYTAVQEVSTGGRIWSIMIRSSQAFDDTISMLVPAMFATGGLLLSLILAALAWSLGSSRARAVALAASMTQDLELALAHADSANQSKSEFLANMSHEIRTPLTAILGYTNLLNDEGGATKAPAERTAALNIIKSAGEHLLTIINDILDLSKIEAGKITVERIDTNVVELLGSILGLMRPRAQTHGVKLHSTFVTPVPERIISDPTRLRQILMNLIGNAAKFTSEGTIDVRVRIEQDTRKQFIVFEIEDTGPGMSLTQVKALFIPFTQADNSVTRKHGGTGLGLTISRRLAEFMGGDVWLERTEVGKGSCFCMRLPFEAVPDAKMVRESCITRSAQPQAVSTGGDLDTDVGTSLTGRYLLAEDNAVNRRLIRFHLSKAGAEVDETENGVKALEMIEEAQHTARPYVMLLTDMQMPEMDGYTLARTLRERGNHIPIIALTAHAMAEDRQKCIDAGCNDYASKPIDREALIGTCQRWSPLGSAPSDNEANTTEALDQNKG